MSGITALPDHAVDSDEPAAGFYAWAVITACGGCWHGEDILDVGPGNAFGAHEVAPGETLLGYHETRCELADDQQNAACGHDATAGDVAGRSTRLPGVAWSIAMLTPMTAIRVRPMAMITRDHGGFRYVCIDRLCDKSGLLTMPPQSHPSPSPSSS